MGHYLVCLSACDSATSEEGVLLCMPLSLRLLSLHHLFCHYPDTVLLLLLGKRERGREREGNEGVFGILLGPEPSNAFCPIGFHLQSDCISPHQIREETKHAILTAGYSDAATPILYSACIFMPLFYIHTAVP